MGFGWDEAKDMEVQEKHGITFQEIRTLIERGGLIKVLMNPSPQYPLAKRPSWFAKAKRYIWFRLK
jgi:uncharacterized DUF497 family protein